MENEFYMWAILLMKVWVYSTIALFVLGVALVVWKIVDDRLQEKRKSWTGGGGIG